MINNGHTNTEEAVRQLTICNACRYCEGFCAVWDAIEMREKITMQDAYYLSNLCHDCRDCYSVCPYNDPHPFKLNIPQVMEKVRLESYVEHTFPKFMRKAFDHPAIYSTATAILITSFSLLFAYYTGGLSAFTSGRLGEIIPPDVYRYITIFLYSYTVVLWSTEGYLYWKAIGGTKNSGWHLGLLRAISDVLLHRNFAGGGTGCNYPSTESGYSRLAFHSMTFFGFIIALIASAFYPAFNGYVLYVYVTSSAFLFLGSLWLFLSHAFERPKLSTSNMLKLDMPFTVLLFLSGITGIAFALLPSGLGRSLTFLIHDGLIASVFILAPFSKFIHPVFRFLSLVKYRDEATWNSTLP